MAGIVFIIAILLAIYLLSYYIYKNYFYFPPVQPKQLYNRRVIITGASRGIGEELAYEYARYNCRLILAARSIDVLQSRVADKCRQLGASQVECVNFDAAKEEACHELIEKAIEHYGGIDILVLNHTASVYEPFFRSDSKTNIENMKRIFAVNFFGYFQTTMEALPSLTLNGTSELPSQIIAVSSLAGTCPLPKTTIYGTSKHAIQGFFLNLARELRTSKPYHNRVTATVAVLGLIATDYALNQTEERIHFLAADVRKTAQAIINAGVCGHSRVFYPRLFGIIPPLYYVFTPLFELAARLGN